jgi:hypothetical protein
MIQNVYFEMVADYLAQASEEDKRNFINSHRSFEYFYLKNGYFDHHKDYRNSVGKYLEELSGMLNETAKEVGLEDAETYYLRIAEELKQHHKQQEEVAHTVDAVVPSYAN